MKPTLAIKTRHQGFTLIEVMIVVAIVGILTAIGIPSYNAYIERSHRAEAKNFLLALSQRMEQNYSISGNYNTLQNGDAVDADFINRAGMGTVPPGDPARARYNIGFVAGQPTGGTFTLQAVPVNAQQADRCGILLINQQSLRGANNILNNRAPLTLECWGR